MKNEKNKSSDVEQMCVDFLNRSGVGSDAVELCKKLIQNMDEGDTCLELDDAQAETLGRCSVVSKTQDSGGLFILDGKKLFTRRNWNYEQKVRTKLDSMQGKIAENTEIPDDPVFSKLHDCQKEAVKMMVENRFSILTGGPGTGKTYTIARAVKLALQGTESLKIGLAAPTGKAAARVNETMVQEFQTLGLNDSSEEKKAKTLHSLLESTYTGVTFKHNHENPLALDWLIVDESSMIDLPLMAKLLEALPDNCRLTLVGDAHQLASVEKGRVFSDLCNLPEFPKCELTTSTRFPEGGPIDLFAKAVNSGDTKTVLKKLENGSELLHFTEFPDRDPASPHFWVGFPDLILRLFREFAKQTTPEGALKQLNRCRILCALNDGPYGITTLNRYLKRLLSEQFPDCPVPFMITENNRELGVNNGDIGVVMPGVNRLFLPDPGKQKVRSIPMELLLKTEMAFASTIHKSQGSEYTDVIIVLPADPYFRKDSEGNKLLTRELLYTAITRTKHEIFLYSGKKAMIRCCEERIIRKTGLKNRD